MFNRKFVKSLLIFVSLGILFASYLAYEIEVEGTTAMLLFLLCIALAVLLALLVDRMPSKETLEMTHKGETLKISFIDRNSMEMTFFSLLLLCLQSYSIANQEEVDLVNVVPNVIWGVLILIAIYKQFNSTAICSKAGISSELNVGIVTLEQIEEIQIEDKRISIHTAKNRNHWVMKKGLVHSPDWRAVKQHFEAMKLHLEGEAE